MLGIGTSTLHLHLCMPFNAVGVGQNHPPRGIDNETGTTGTILPSSLPRQGKVGSAVNTPNLGMPLIHGRELEKLNTPSRQCYRMGI